MWIGWPLPLQSSYSTDCPYLCRRRWRCGGIHHYVSAVFVYRRILWFLHGRASRYLYTEIFLFAGIIIFSAIRMMAYGKGHFSGVITFLRSFALLLAFLAFLPQIWGMTGVWFAVPAAEFVTMFVSFLFLKINQ